MKDAIEVLCGRRSIRKYKPDQITNEELELVLKAGTCAPTALNQQSPIIIAVQNKEEIAKLSKLNAIINGKENTLNLNYSGEKGSFLITCVKDSIIGDAITGEVTPMHPMRIAKKVRAQKGIVTMKFKFL